MTTPKRYSRYATYIAPLGKIPIIKTYGTTIFTLFMMSIFILFAIRPTVETIIILQKQLSDYQQVLDKINQKSSNLAIGIENYKKISNSPVLQKVQTAIPENVELRTFVRSLEDTALKNEATISGLQLQPLSIEQENNTSQKTLSTMDFTFNVSAPYPKLLIILNKLKTTPRLISVDRVLLTRSTETRTVLMSISGKAYYLK